MCIELSALKVHCLFSRIPYFLKYTPGRLSKISFKRGGGRLLEGGLLIWGLFDGDTINWHELVFCFPDSAVIEA